MTIILVLLSLFLSITIVGEVSAQYYYGKVLFVGYSNDTLWALIEGKNGTFTGTWFRIIASQEREGMALCMTSLVSEKYIYFNVGAVSYGAEITDLYLTNKALTN
jgi:hypothetical protein